MTAGDAEQQPTRRREEEAKAEEAEAALGAGPARRLARLGASTAAGAERDRGGQHGGRGQARGDRGAEGEGATGRRHVLGRTGRGDADSGSC